MVQSLMQALICFEPQESDHSLSGWMTMSSSAYCVSTYLPTTRSDINGTPKSQPMEVVCRNRADFGSKVKPCLMDTPWSLMRMPGCPSRISHPTSPNHWKIHILHITTLMLTISQPCWVSPGNHQDSPIWVLNSIPGLLMGSPEPQHCNPINKEGEI